MSSQASGRERKESLGFEEAERMARSWIDEAERPGEEEYVFVTDFDAEVLGRARSDSYYWCDAFLRAEANPHEISSRHGYHSATEDTIDLLRHEYTAQGAQVTVIEGRNFLLVEIGRQSCDVLSMPPSERGKAIERVTSSLLKPVSMGKGFQLPRSIEEGCSFSTAPEVNVLLMGAASDRIDAGVRDGRIYFLCYKKISQEVGYRDARKWFDTPLRSARR